MIYRILIDDVDPGLRFLLSLGASDPRLAPGLHALQARWRRDAVRRLRGVDPFGALMDRHGLRAPLLSQKRARSYFTERGWTQVGRHVAAAARRGGHVVKVIRRKEPPRSQIVRRDDLQVALLPANRKKAPQRRERETRQLCRYSRLAAAAET